MTITINATGAERKRLVQIISKWLGCEAKYLGVPSCAYRVDYFTIEKNGSLTFDDSADSEVVERLLQHIYDEGFDIDQSHTENEEEISGVCISMPRSLFTGSSLENLKAIVAAKGSLIKKALGTDELPIEVTDTKVSFPWFMGTPTLEEILVCNGNVLIFRFYDGSEVTRKWKDRSRSQSWTDDMKEAARQKALERSTRNA